MLKIFRRFLGFVAFFAFPLLFLLGCQESLPPQLQGYTKLSGATYYQLLRLGEGRESAHPGDYITVHLRYLTWEDSCFFEGGRRFQLERPAYKGSIEECFAMLSAGDSASFYLDAYRFFTKTLSTTLPSFLDSAQSIRVDVRVIDIQDSLTFSREKEAFLHWIEDFQAYEEEILRQYLMRENLDMRAIDSLYYMPITAGTGDYPKNGDTLVLEYEGRFLDGKYFDSTRKRGEAFQFVLGQQWQIIDGLDRALRLMRAGERSLFIFPSSEAFGQQGSSTGIVPPYTPVIFEVELVELKPGKQ